MELRLALLLLVLASVGADRGKGWESLCRSHCHDADAGIRHAKALACAQPAQRVRETCESAFDAMLESDCERLCKASTAQAKRDGLFALQFCKRYKRMLPKPTLYDSCVAGAGAGAVAAGEYTQALGLQWKRPIEDNRPSGADFAVVTASSANHFKALLFFKSCMNCLGQRWLMAAGRGAQFS